MKFVRLITVFLFLSATLMAATISGIIKDTDSGKGLEFANVALHDSETDEVITGTMSGVDGSFRIFNVPEGVFNIVVTYMGYERKTVPGIKIGEDQRNLDVGDLKLKPTTLHLEGVVVSEEKPAVSYKIDKRIVDASQFLSAQGGSAVDILENVPSVDVDIEGNVTLRGNSNFTVMVDGRPSVLEPQDALESIPAASIENIEIMTNASAKFEAEGGAGIINIVTRRDKRIGINGIASLNLGTNNLGADLLLNYTAEKYNVFMSVDYGKRSFSGEAYTNRLLTQQDTVTRYISEGDRLHERGGIGVRGGVDWYISKDDILGLSFHWGDRSSEGSSSTDYTVEYGDPVFLTENYTNREYEIRSGGRYSVNMDYTHKFNGSEKTEKTSKPGAAPGMNGNNSARVHQIKLNTSYSNWNMDEISYAYLIDEEIDTLDGKMTEEFGPSNNFRADLEYQLPIGENNKFEAGWNSRLGWKEDGNNVYYRNPADATMELQDNYSYYTESRQNTHSLYAMYSGEYGLLGYQPGIRAEYTYRKIESNAQDSALIVKSLYVFPTLHFSYELPANIQLMASYTRRISRPRGWQLEPFYTWSDAYNIRVGNPELLPEMRGSYDFSVQKRFGKNFISLDAYYNHTKDKIERIQTIYEDDVILSTYENVGEDRSLGVELMSNMNFNKWWMLNLSARLYYYQVEGSLYGENFDRTSMNYGGRLRNTFVIAEKTRIQLGLYYRSRSATAQGSSSGGIMSDLSVRQDLFNDKLSVTLQMRDVFGTAFHEYTTVTPEYTTTSSFSRQWPMISLNLSLKINNYKEQKRTENGDFESEEFDINGTSEF